MVISENEIKIQNTYADKINELNINHNKKACVITYGCQQNVNDSEKIKSYLERMGYIITEDSNDANVIIYNTCAVREGAEERVFGNIGALKHRKVKEPDLIIGICGCMAQQKGIAETIKSKFKHIDIVFGTHSLYKFPEILYNAITENKRQFSVYDSEGIIAEGIPQKRDDKYKASVSIMYGCNNFCSYCIVPYVRGRERSRTPDNIIAEIKSLANEGYKEIMLLGQNVNSYGKDLNIDYDFSDLLREINNIDGIKRIRFMTSHPKDISDKLIDVMAECENITEYLHLPFQAGSNRILKKMNRKYTIEDYLETIDKLKKKIPGIALSSDIIVGFPGETKEDVLKTIEVIKKVRFDTLFTFIFSPRVGTPAAKMDDPVSDKEKHENFEMVLEVQNQISKEINDSYVGNVYEVLVDGISKNNSDMLSGRTRTNKIINFLPINAKEGDFVNVRVTKSQTWALIGEEVK